MGRKHLSTIANDLLQRCAQVLNTTVDELVEEFEASLKGGEADDHSRKLVEFCGSKALANLCCDIKDKINDGFLSRITFNMMLAWETPRFTDEESHSNLIQESVAKGKEDQKEAVSVDGAGIDDDIPLFYSDLMPLLVSEERNVGEDAFVWLASLFPMVADAVNGRFTFETLTAPTASRLHFPAYDKLLKEIDKSAVNLKKQSTPKGSELSEDEFILHVEGTARTQRVVRHIGTTSWPGRATLTNKALYFEASGVLTYEVALRIDLSNPNADHQVKPASTGPFGAPLFDKAIMIVSSELPEPVIIEFPELTSSTRRDLWLTLMKEVILLHKFIATFKLESPLHAWEIQARTILGVLRLYAAREMMKISPPAPKNFLIFSLFDELPKGDYVLEELAARIERMDSLQPCSAASILKSLDMKHPMLSTMEVKELGPEEQSNSQAENLASLDTTINQVREEAREVQFAKATAEGLKEEGLSDSLVILVELLSPLKEFLPWLQQDLISWKRPGITFSVLVVTWIAIYKEAASYALAALLLSLVGFMIWARRERIAERCPEIVICTSSDKTTMESLVEAQHTLNSIHEFVQNANITMLKIRSILEYRSPKHSNQVMCVMIVAAAAVALVPFRYVLMSITLMCFSANLKAGKSVPNMEGNRRLKEWRESIPVPPVRTVKSSPP